MAREKRYSTYFLLAAYVSMTICYRFAVAIFFGYEGYDYGFFSISKMLITSGLTLVLIVLHGLIRDDFYRAVYSTYLMLAYLGHSVFYVFNEARLILVLYVSAPLVTLYVVQLFDRHDRNHDIKLKLSDQLTRFAFIAIAVLLVVPYLKNLGSVNLSNLLLRNIYETRSMHSEQSSPVTAYLFSPVSRVVLPFLLVYSLERRKKWITVLSVLGLVLMFLLNGALKSIFFGTAACVFFYQGGYSQKENRFFKTIAVLGAVALLEPALTRSHMIADYIRRVFFVPPSLFETYYSYFARRPTYFLHSRLSKILGINEYNQWIPYIIGEQVLGQEGLNANVGVLVEGFASFGAVGVLVASVVFAYVARYLNRRALSPAYFGMLFSYVYVINTSFIETLFVTHGLLFYLIFARFVIPKARNDPGRIA